MARQGYMLSYGLFKVSHLTGGGSLLVTRIAISISTTYNSSFNIMGGRRVNFNPASEVEMTIFPDSYTFVVQPGREWEAIQTVLTYPNKPLLSTHMMDSIAYEKEPGIVWQLVSPAGTPVMIICGNEQAYFMSEEPGLVTYGAASGFSDVTRYSISMTFEHYTKSNNYSILRDDLNTFDPEGYHAP